MRRKAQFFIITAVLVAGSLSITVNVLDDYARIEFDAMTASPGAQQFSTFVDNIDDLWYDQTWTYRRRVRVREVSGRDVETYPVSIQLDTAELIDDGKMQPGCQDLRVVEGTQELPYQIEEGECNTANTTIWFLASVAANQNEGDFYVLYGNDQVAAPDYDTGLAFDPAEERLENSLVSFRAGTSGGWYGFTSARRSGADANDIAANGTIIFRQPEGPDNNLTLVEKGPVYITVSFNATHNYTLFARSAFLRREGPVTIPSGGTKWYGDDPTVLTQWQAGGPGNTAPVSSGSFSGEFGPGQYAYIAATNGSSQESLAMFVRNSSIDQYAASSGSGGQRMGVSALGGPVRVQEIDWWLGENGVPDYVADRMLRPPRTFLTDTEQIGQYFPSSGWRYKVTLEIEENSGQALVNYPVNVSLNTGQLGVQEDCEDIVVTEEGVRRPYMLREQCDSVPFQGPDGFTFRLPMDESYGGFVNGTEPRFTGSIIDGDDTARWLLGAHRYALSLQTEDYIHFGRSPRVSLRGSGFTVSTWINVDAVQDFTDQVSVLRYPGDTPTINIINQSGDFVLQARLMNDTEPGTLTTVTGSTDLASGGWHHIAVRYDDQDGNVSLFVDGQLDGTGRFVGPMDFVQDKNFTIGQGLSADIDEFKVYKDALSDDAIRDQQQRFTELTLVTNLTASQVQRDVAIFAGSATSIQGTYTATDLNLARAGTVTEPRVVASQPTTYQETIITLQRHINDISGLGRRFSLTIEEQCTLVEYQSTILEVSETVC